MSCVRTLWRKPTDPMVSVVRSVIGVIRALAPVAVQEQTGQFCGHQATLTLIAGTNAETTGLLRLNCSWPYLIGQARSDI
jgi:hypothetical protein